MHSRPPPGGRRRFVGAGEPLARRLPGGYGRLRRRARAPRRGPGEWACARESIGRGTTPEGARRSRPPAARTCEVVRLEPGEPVLLGPARWRVAAPPCLALDSTAVRG